MEFEQENWQTRIVADEVLAVEGEFLRMGGGNFFQQSSGIGWGAVDAPLAGNRNPDGSWFGGKAGGGFA